MGVSWMGNDSVVFETFMARLELEKSNTSGLIKTKHREYGRIKKALFKDSQDAFRRTVGYLGGKLQGVTIGQQSLLKLFWNGKLSAECFRTSMLAVVSLDSNATLNRGAISLSKGVLINHGWAKFVLGSDRYVMCSHFGSVYHEDEYNRLLNPQGVMTLSREEVIGNWFKEPFVLPIVPADSYGHNYEIKDAPYVADNFVFSSGIKGFMDYDADKGLVKKLDVSKG